MLAPFEYYATHDDVDLTNIQWTQINVDAQLDNIISASDIRARWHFKPLKLMLVI